MPKGLAFSQEYIKSCFDAWYLNGRPNTPAGIKRILPEHPSGHLPSTSMINQWITRGAWDAWADELDAQVYQKDDKLLINKKAAMLRRQLEKSEKIANKAYEHILADGFDSTSSAVQAFFKGMEEMRKVAGFSDLLEKLDKMTNNEVEREIITLLNRASANEQVIDSDAEDVPLQIEDNTEE